MKTLYLDIETLPAPESHKDGLRDGSLLKGSKRRELENRGFGLTDKEIEAMHRETALNGDFGRVLCLGWRLDPVDASAKIASGEESSILEAFWQLAAEAELFVGHNVLDFDLRFLIKRSVILGVRPSRELPVQRYASRPVYDTMHEWNRWSGEMISMDLLAKVLGLPSSKTTLSGGKVFEAYKAGEIERIHDYCRADVELSRLIHRRMVFLDPVPAP